MKLNETGLFEMIRQRLRLKDLKQEEAVMYPFYVDVGATRQTVELGQDIVVLVNEILDVPFTTQVVIDSNNNILVTSKVDYENMQYAGYQFFEERPCLWRLQCDGWRTDFLARFECRLS